MKRRDNSVIAEVAVLVAVYFAAAKLGLSLAFLNGSVSPVWPPTGVAIAAMLLLGYRATPGIALAAFLANYLLTPVGVVTAAGIATGNTLEAVTALFLLRIFVKQENFFNRAVDFLKFVLIAAIISPAVAATIGNLCIDLNGSASWQNFGHLWLTWWSGDGVGALVVTPLILTWIEKPPERFPARRWLEAAALALALTIIELWIFSTFLYREPTRYPLGHFAIPILIWAAIRFGPRGAATAIGLISVIAVWGTTRGVGPFGQANTNDALLLLQAFIADLAITSLVLAAIVTERRRAQNAASFAASIVDSTDDVVIGKDLNGKILSWNKAAERIYGYTAEEVIGRPISILLPPGKPDEIKQIMATLQSGGRIENYETVRMTKDGREIDVSLTISPIRNASGEMTWASAIGRDITGRKRGEQALFESREWMRMTMEGSRLGTWTRRLDETNRVQWSPELERIFGLEPGEFPETEEAFFNFVHPDDRERLAAAVQRAIENQTDYDVEFRYTPKGGGVRWMLGRGRAFYDAGGKPFRLAGLGWDITERKETEHALEIVSNLPSENPDPVIRLHEGRVITYANAAAQRMLKKRKLEVGDEAPAEIAESARAVLLGGKRRGFELAFGNQIYQVTFAPITNANYVNLYFSDITDLKRAEDALLQNQEAFRLAHKVARGGTWQWDLVTNTVEWSDEYYELLGLSGTRVRPSFEELSQRIYPDDLGLVLKEHEGAIAEKRDVDVEFRIKRGDGEWRWFHRTGRCVYAGDGKPQSMIGITFDITERKLAEEERQKLLVSEQAARAEAEAANRIKDEFLATVSHELRTPLNAIVGWTSMLRNGLDPDRVAHAISIIDRNARAQAQLVDDILEVSRIVSGKVRLDTRPVDLGQVIEAAIESVRPAADSKKIQLTTMLEHPGPVLGDADRLQQIVWNLLSNAVKFTPVNGRVEVQMSSAGPQVEVTVSDNGEGVSPEFLPHVFDRFRQADGTITRQHKGLGLGLAIVRHLCELHGGSVSAESAGVGQGARFKVSFPLLIGKTDSESGQARVSFLPEVNGINLEGLRVLIVDDEADARELISTILTKAGAHVKAAASAPEALSLLSEWRPDLMISDLEMPGEDGYSLIRQVRKLDATRGGATLALALTAHARTEDRESALQAGFQLHVAKPVQPAELMLAIASLTNNHHKTS